MKRPQCQAVLLTVAACLSTSVQPAAAELRCTSQSSTAERLICADDTLQRLDTRLNEVYGNAAQHVPDRMALVKEQRVWLKGTRDACADAPCMRKVLNERMRQLAELQLRHEPIKVDEIPDAEALESCREIARLAEQGRLSRLALHGQPVNQELVVAIAGEELWGLSQTSMEGLKERIDGMSYAEEVYRLKINRGAPVKFSKVGMLGTCRSDQVFNVPLVLKGNDEGVDEVHDPNDQLTWQHWGSTEYPIYFNGRNYTITSGHTDLNSVSMISVVRPNGRIRPLCLATVKKAWREPAMARDQALCAAVADKRLNPVHWKDITQVLPLSRLPATYQDEFVRRYGEYANTVSIVHLDIDGDGTVERVARFEYNSGGGCGSTQTWLRVMADDDGRVVRQALSPLLEKIANGPLNIYEYGGRRYIETSDDNQREILVTIRDRHIEPVCEFKSKSELEVTLLTKK